MLPTETLAFDNPGVDEGIPVEFPDDDLLVFPDQAEPLTRPGQVFVPGKIMMKGKNGFRVTSVLISKDENDEPIDLANLIEAGVDNGLRTSVATTTTPTTTTPASSFQTFTAYPEKHPEQTTTPDKTEVTLLRLIETLVHMAEMVKGLNSI